MSTKNISISYADVPGFAAGTSVASVTLIVTDPSGVATNSSLQPGQASTTYEATAVGSYAVSAQGVDQNGNLLGSPATTSFSVDAPATVTLSLPFSLNIS